MRISKLSYLLFALIALGALILSFIHPMELAVTTVRDLQNPNHIPAKPMPINSSAVSPETKLIIPDAVLDNKIIKNEKPVTTSAPAHLPLNLYLDRIPRLYQHKPELGTNLRYVNSMDTEGPALVYLKDMSDKGDPRAKSLYANRVAYLLHKSFREELLMQGEALDTAKWRNEFSEVQNLLIEAASEGEHLAALQLTSYPPLAITNDKEEVLAWALIADKIGQPSGHAIYILCNNFAEECTDKLLSSSTERALMYIDLFKIKQAPRDE